MRLFALSAIISLWCVGTIFSQVPETDYISIFQDTTRVSALDTSGICYIGLGASYIANSRLAGVPEALQGQVGNEPIIPISLIFRIMGAKFLQVKNVRSIMQVGLIPNVYQGRTALANLYLQGLFGYNVIDNRNWNLFPFVGYAVQTMKISPELTARSFLLQGGIGVDYFVPRSPFLLGIQAGYSYNADSQSLSSLITGSGSLQGRHGFVVQMQACFHLWTD